MVKSGLIRRAGPRRENANVKRGRLSSRRRPVRVVEMAVGRNRERRKGAARSQYEYSKQPLTFGFELSPNINQRPCVWTTWMRRGADKLSCEIGPSYRDDSGSSAFRIWISRPRLGRWGAVRAGMPEDANGDEEGCGGGSLRRPWMSITVSSKQPKP